MAAEALITHLGAHIPANNLRARRVFSYLQVQNTHAEAVKSRQWSKAREAEESLLAIVGPAGGAHRVLMK